MSQYQPPYLARLQDLKVWQVNYDSVQQNKREENIYASDYQNFDSVPALERSNDRGQPLADNTDWDKKAISPTKPFAQLLEEKLAEEEPIQVQSKPKRPFLRKGAGLLRYKLGARVSPRRKSEALQKRFDVMDSISPEKKNNLRAKVDANTEPEVCMIPLKMPDVCIKPKTTWSKFDPNANNYNGKRHDLQGMVIGNNRLDSKPVQSNSYANEIDHSLFTRLQGNENIQTSMENTLERDLRIFETLEERVEHPSFSSTNSSIIKMLVNSPRKLKMIFKNSSTVEESKEIPNPDVGNSNPTQAYGLESISKTPNLLHEFLENLKKIADENQVKKQQIAEDRSRGSPDTSYSESLSYTDTRSQSPSSFYTDFENTLKDKHIHKIEIGVNTSFTQDNHSEYQKVCWKCQELAKSLDNLKRQMPDIEKEKNRLCYLAKDFEERSHQFSVEMQKLKDSYDRDVDDLKEELAASKKKFATEKALFDMYIKESQNKPSKKEREEILALKKELTDTKELLKLKEVKNGATQARLRNQVKTLEKEKTELKSTLENLQKENSKLVAAQKVRRPSEVKMLHEINKNLSKLTEETFKNQVTKSDICNDLRKNEKNYSRERTSSGDDIFQKNKDKPKQKRRSVSCKEKKTTESFIDENHEKSSNMTNFVDLSLEKEYENCFGNSPKNVMQTSLANDSKRDKTEEVFPDGSKHIKYSNGNSKTISPDGKLIIVQYYNGDIKETDINLNTLKYYYAQNDTWQTQFEDGSELLEYANGQKEKRFKDGRKEIKCPDGTLFIKTSDGMEEVQYPDGSKMVKSLNGNKILYLPNGQKEIHTNDHKRREYPDGTVKILYLDGTQETRYSSGRIRIKDANGILLMDSQSS